jgi:hypothetical protein
MTTETLIGTPDPEPTHNPITGAKMKRQPTVDDLLDLRATLSLSRDISASRERAAAFEFSIELLDSLLASL